MAASIARRSAFLRNLWRTTNNSTNISYSISPPPSIRSNFMFQHTRISPPCSPSSRLRRESLFLNSLLPFHSAIASACLVSNLPKEASTSTEVLFIGFSQVVFIVETPRHFDFTKMRERDRDRDRDRERREGGRP